MEIKEYLKNVKGYEKDYLQTIGLLLYSIRCDWSDVGSVLVRAQAAKCLCDMLINHYNYNNEEGKKSLIDELEETIQEYRGTIDEALGGSQFLELGVVIDGRYFRSDFPKGYIGIRPDDFGEVEDE